jgi:hypothetical protein
VRLCIRLITLPQSRRRLSRQYEILKILFFFTISFTNKLWCRLFFCMHIRIKETPKIFLFVVGLAQCIKVPRSIQDDTKGTRIPDDTALLRPIPSHCALLKTVHPRWHLDTVQDYFLYPRARMLYPTRRGLCGRYCEVLSRESAA